MLLYAPLAKRPARSRRPPLLTEAGREGGVAHLCQQEPGEREVSSISANKCQARGRCRPSLPTRARREGGVVHLCQQEPGEREVSPISANKSQARRRDRVLSSSCGSGGLDPSHSLRHAPPASHPIPMCVCVCVCVYVTRK